MDITVVHPSELGASELARWREIQGSDPILSNPFLAPEFSVAVGRFRRQARVAVLSEGSSIGGFFPFERASFGMGLPICSGHNDCQGLVVSPELDVRPEALLRACGLSVWEFDHLVDGQRLLAPFVADKRLSPVMDLSQGFDSYAEHLRQGPNRLKNIYRKQRKLERDLGELRFVYDAVDRQLLHKVLTWKSAQYLRNGWADRFARPWFVELMESLLDTRSGTFAGNLSILYAGDRPIAGHFGMRSGSVLAHWYPSYDLGLGEYSPGLVMHLALAEGAAGAGIKHVDMGPGPETYKQWFRSRDIVVAQGRIARGAMGAAMYWSKRVPRQRLERLAREHPGLGQMAKRLRAGYGRGMSAVRPTSSLGA